MKTAVLDATELSRDWLCAGLKYQILEHTGHLSWLTVVVPPSVFEEVVANHARQVEKAVVDFTHLNRFRSRLGLRELSANDDQFDYRNYLAERFDTQLGITVLDWPSVSHPDLVARAVNRTPPFDGRGSGYRDSLVWENVLELARKGDDVALVSADGVFAGPDKALAPKLAAEIALLRGTVELVRDFGPWLLNQLPWEADSLASAVATSRNDVFYHYFLHSDFDEYLTPEVEDLGFRWPPSSCQITESYWGGSFTAVDSRTGPDGYTLVEYDIDQVVTFQAEFPEGIEPEPGWAVSEPDLVRRVQVVGEIVMVVRIAVLFGGEFGFSVEELSWRTTGHAGRGASVLNGANDPNQLSLLTPDSGDVLPEYVNTSSADLLI